MNKIEESIAIIEKLKYFQLSDPAISQYILDLKYIVKINPPNIEKYLCYYKNILLQTIKDPYIWISIDSLSKKIITKMPTRFGHVSLKLGLN